MMKCTELLIGRLGKKPDLRYTKDQKPICYLSVAINKNKEEKAIWRKVIVWGRQAELCTLHLKKGSEIFVQGQNDIREFTGRDGLNKTYEVIKARLIGFPNV